MQDWHSEIEQSRKGLHYKHFKTQLNVETYLKSDIQLKFKIAFSKLRCSSHNLFVESGRHQNIPYNERICSLCNTQSIEDEFHVFMVCPFYNDLRHQYLNDLIDLNNINMNAFYNLISTTNVIKLKAICIFVYEMFKSRQVVLEPE